MAGQVSPKQASGGQAESPGNRSLQLLDAFILLKIPELRCSRRRYRDCSPVVFVDGDPSAPGAASLHNPPPLGAPAHGRGTTSTTTARPEAEGSPTSSWYKHVCFSTSHTRAIPSDETVTSRVPSLVEAMPEISSRLGALMRKIRFLLRSQTSACRVDGAGTGQHEAAAGAQGVKREEDSARPECLSDRLTVEGRQKHQIAMRTRCMGCSPVNCSRRPRLGRLGEAYLLGVARGYEALPVHRNRYALHLLPRRTCDFPLAFPRLHVKDLNVASAALWQHNGGKARADGHTAVFRSFSIDLMENLP